MALEPSRPRHTSHYRDSTGRSLADYPRPSVAVDTAVLTLAPRTAPRPGEPPVRLCVLLVRRPEHHTGVSWALPGTFLHPGERLADAVARALADKAGVRAARPTQLAVFDAPDRDDRGWVLSVAHLASVRYAALAGTLDAHPEAVRLAPVSRPGPLPYDHAAIVTAAAQRLRAGYAERPDPARFLGASFTIRSLRHVHEAVAGTTLQKDTFRRTMQAWLTPTGTLSEGSVGRPSELFRRRR